MRPVLLFHPLNSHSPDLSDSPPPSRMAASAPGDMTFTHQTHTTNVAVVKEKDRGGRFPETDGMVTNVPGICLVTFYADCVPLFFVDPVSFESRPPEIPPHSPSRDSAGTSRFLSDKTGRSSTAPQPAPGIFRSRPR